MTISLSHIDSAFTNQYKNLLAIQRNIAEQLKQYRFDPEGNEITQAVYERMMAFWYFHVNNCIDLGREVNTVASDFFTETCLFFLKPYFKQKGLDIVSEKDIRKEKTNQKVIRPDLSIWDGDELVAVIELKVSDGWKGKTMTEHLDNRNREIQNIWPGVFFGALSFWNCFGENGMAENNPNYIGLYHFKSDNNHVPTGQTIEQLVERMGAAGRDVACRVSTTERTDVDCTDVAGHTDAAGHVSTTPE